MYYRAMVGPFGSRDEAMPALHQPESSRRQLRCAEELTARALTLAAARANPRRWRHALSSPDLAGLDDLAPDERAFLREAAALGPDPVQAKHRRRRRKSLILFVIFRDIVGREAPVLVDQEGGRVQRLGPPHWPAYPPGARYGALYDRDPAAGLAAARLGARLIAADLLDARHQRRLPAAGRRAGRRRATP